ncbi:MAG: AMP-binding protein, partial [Parasphingopyxis sp.]
MSEIVWTYATLWESIAEAQPDAPVVIQGEDEMSWGELDRQADALAGWLIGEGLTRQSKLAAYMPNRAEYLVVYYAGFKAGFAPLNINYRYTASELEYLIDNADAEAVVFDVRYAETIQAVRDRLDTVRRWIAVGAGEATCPDWAVRYEDT